MNPYESTRSQARSTGAAPGVSRAITRHLILWTMLSALAIWSNSALEVKT